MLSDYDFEVLEEKDYVVELTEPATLGKIIHLNEITGNVTVRWESRIACISILPAYKLVKIGPEELI